MDVQKDKQCLGKIVFIFNKCITQCTIIRPLLIYFVVLNTSSYQASLYDEFSLVKQLILWSQKSTQKDVHNRIETIWRYIDTISIRQPRYVLCLLRDISRYDRDIRNQEKSRPSVIVVLVFRFKLLAWKSFIF